MLRTQEVLAPRTWSRQHSHHQDQSFEEAHQEEKRHHSLKDYDKETHQENRLSFLSGWKQVMCRMTPSSADPARCAC